MYVQVEVGGIASPPVRWVNGAFSTDSVIPFFTVVIYVKDGTVSTVNWDTYCTGCDACQDGICAVPRSECLTFANDTDSGKKDCNFKVCCYWLCSFLLFFTLL